MKELKSTYDTDFEDFNPACLSLIDTSQMSSLSKIPQSNPSPTGKAVPVGLFSRPQSRIERPTDKVTNIDPVYAMDNSRNNTLEVATTAASKNGKSVSRSPVNCFDPSINRSPVCRDPRESASGERPADKSSKVNLQVEIDSDTVINIQHPAEEAEDTQAIEQMNGYLQQVSRLCDSMHIDEAQRSELKRSLGHINSQILGMQRATSSNQSISQKKGGSQMFINLQQPQSFNKRYIRARKGLDRTSDFTEKAIVQRSMY